MLDCFGRCTNKSIKCDAEFSWPASEWFDVVADWIRSFSWTLSVCHCASETFERIRGKENMWAWAESGCYGVCAMCVWFVFKRFWFIDEFLLEHRKWKMQMPRGDFTFFSFVVACAGTMYQTFFYCLTLSILINTVNK